MRDYIMSAKISSGNICRCAPTPNIVDAIPKQREEPVMQLSSTDIRALQCKQRECATRTPGRDNRDSAGGTNLLYLMKLEVMRLTKLCRHLAAGPETDSLPTRTGGLRIGAIGHEL